jgi:hypothetical protein
MAILSPRPYRLSITTSSSKSSRMREGTIKRPLTSIVCLYSPMSANRLPALLVFLWKEKGQGLCSYSPLLHIPPLSSTSAHNVRVSPHEVNFSRLITRV